MSTGTFLRLLAGVFAGLLALFLLGFAVFAATLPRTAQADPARLEGLAAGIPPEARGIVALTGGAGARIEHALSLQAEGLGDRVLISGVNPRIGKADLSGTGNRDQLACCVDLGPFARTTRGNALEARAWLRTHGYRTVYLVTSNFHLPRARAEMSRLAPEIQVIGVPVNSNSVPDGAWMGSPRAWRTVGGEYVKMIAAQLRA